MTQWLVLFGTIPSIKTTHVLHWCAPDLADVQEAVSWASHTTFERNMTWEDNQARIARGAAFCLQPNY